MLQIDGDFIATPRQLHGELQEIKNIQFALESPSNSQEPFKSKEFLQMTVIELLLLFLFIQNRHPEQRRIIR